MSNSVDQKALQDAITAGVAAAMQKYQSETDVAATANMTSEQLAVLTGAKIALKNAETVVVHEAPINNPVPAAHPVATGVTSVVTHVTELASLASPTIPTVSTTVTQDVEKAVVSTVVTDVKAEAETVATKVMNAIDTAEQEVEAEYDKVSDEIKADLTAAVAKVKAAGEELAAKAGSIPGVAAVVSKVETIVTDIKASKVGQAVEDEFDKAEINLDAIYGKVVDEEVALSDTGETAPEVKAENLRMIQWLSFSVVCYVIAWFFAQQDWLPSIQTIFQKLGHINLGAFVGYWIDRTAFRDRITVDSSDSQKLRRAVIIGVSMLAIGMGI